MQKNFYDQDFKLGIIGGGQLGRMFIQEAINYNLDVHILDGDPNAPCKSIATSFTHGSITDYETVLQFGRDKDLITVEIENINIEALEVLENQGVKIFPQPKVLKIIRDKGLQKQFYVDHAIPTSPFVLLKNLDELKANSHKLPGAHKLRTGGYDGKGVIILKSELDIESSFDAPSILESLVPFKKELSVIVARNEKGETITYPCVECEFNPNANLVEFLFAPADVDSKVEENAKRIAIDIISKLNMVGILAVEFFLLENDELLVNEIAPRPHNSGHHTIECNVTSQFEQHMRAILNLPLGNTEIVLPGVMINLLGENGYSGKVKYEGLAECMSKKGVFIHLYGKKETKPFRKMGHVTIALPSLEDSKKTALEIKGKIKVIS